LRLVDTNMLVDVVRDPGSRDTAWLGSLAGESAHGGEPLIVTESVFVECLWVLRSALGLQPADAARVLRAILESEGVEAWDAPLAASALNLHERDPRLDIVDCLLVARSQLDGAEVVTADRLLKRTIAAGPGGGERPSQPQSR